MSNNISALTTIWSALHDYRENSIPESDSRHDDQWDDICEAMAAIHESLNIDQVDT